MRRNHRKALLVAALTTAAFAMQTATALAGSRWY
jgi:hypothetical protein